MVGFWRRRLAAELRPALAGDERVVEWARSAGGGVVVATTLGLFLPGRPERLGWHEIHKVTWTGRELRIVPAVVAERREGYVVTADAPVLAAPLAEPGKLPEVVRARVTRSVSLSSHYPLPGGGVRVVARRVPGVDGVSWAVRYDEGTDATAAHTVAATDQLVTAHARAI